MYLNQEYHTPTVASYKYWYENICMAYAKNPKKIRIEDSYDKESIDNLISLLNDIVYQDVFTLKELWKTLNKIPKSDMNILQITSDMYSTYDSIDGSIYCFATRDETPDEVQKRLKKSYETYCDNYFNYHKRLRKYINEVKKLSTFQINEGD